MAGSSSDRTSSDGASWKIYDLYYEISFVDLCFETLISFADLCYETLISFADLYCAIFPYFLT